MNHEAYFFSSLLQSGSFAALRGVQREWFHEEWLKVYDFVWAFVRDRHALPRPETVEGSCAVVLPSAQEDVSFYAATLRDNAMRVTIEEGFSERVVPALGEARPGDALAGARDVIAEVSRTFRDHDRGLILDIDSNVDLRMADYLRRKHAQDGVGLPLPWPTMMTATGGPMPGEVWSFLARPNVGKTWVLVVIAVWLWQLGDNVLFASMETPPQGAQPRDKRHRVVRGGCIRCFTQGASPQEECPAPPRQQLSVRFDAVGARLSAWRLLKGCLTPPEEQRLHQYYEVLKNQRAYGWGNLRIVSAPAISSVGDLETEIMGMGPDVVFWDSAYLAAAKGRGGKRTDRAGELVEDIKHMLERAGLPGVISWHFNREVDEKATNASQNNAALTDDLGRIWDVLMGMFRPPEVKDAGEAIFRSLKVRDGIEMPELKTVFRVKEEINFAEISNA